MVHWAYHACTRDFYSALAALVSLEQNNFFLSVHYFNSFVPIAQQYFVLGRLEQPRQDKNLLFRHDKPNKPTKEGLLSFVLFESPFTSVSTVSRAHPSLGSLLLIAPFSTVIVHNINMYLIVCMLQYRIEIKVFYFHFIIHIGLYLPVWLQ